MDAKQEQLPYIVLWGWLLNICREPEQWDLDDTYVSDVILVLDRIYPSIVLWLYFSTSWDYHPKMAYTVTTYAAKLCLLTDEVVAMVRMCRW